MDYRDFLSRRETVVLPYFGGRHVFAPDRRLRLQGQAEAGWWTFEVEGRKATAVAPAEPDFDQLDRLPVVRGHWARGWLFTSGRELDRFALPPEMEPEALAPCTGRRWSSGHLLFGSTEFEDEAEDQARRALERGEAIAEVKGVGPGLRAAFGFALAAREADRIGMPLSPREAAPATRDIADRGRPAAIELLERIADERRQWAELLAEERRAEGIRNAAARVHRVDRRGSPGDRAERALDDAGARMLSHRRVGNGQLEVAFEFMGERFISLVDPGSLHVYDAGICLSGADEELTLESLPSVIREAIDGGLLYITRH